LSWKILFITSRFRFMNNDQSFEELYDDIEHGLYFSYMLVFFIGITLLLTLLYDQYSFSIFLIILLIMGFVLRTWSRLSPKNLFYNVHVESNRLFLGERTGLTFTIENKKLLPVILKLKLTVSSILNPNQVELKITENSAVLWYQKFKFDRELVPQKRGIYKTGSPRLITGDFFGFFPKIKTITSDVDIIVYPRSIPLKPFPILKRAMFGKPATASPVQDPIYVLGTRDYQGFSPSRSIHWKASARHNRLQEKIFESTEQEKVLLILEADTFYQNEHIELFEKTIETIASLSIILDSMHYAVGFLTNCAIIGAGPNYVAVKRGAGHLPNLLETLARIYVESYVKMKPLLEQKHYFPSGVSCLYFSCKRGKNIESLYQQRISVKNIISFQDPHISQDPKIEKTGISCSYLHDFILEN